jgi:hypothetical protein
MVDGNELRSFLRSAIWMLYVVHDLFHLQTFYLEMTLDS